MIKMLTSISGEKDGKPFDFAAGDEAGVFSKGEESRMIERGLAESVKPVKKKVSKKK